MPTTWLTSHENPTKATELLQKFLHELQKWLNAWRIKVNESKSTHVTFTLRRENCPPVMLNEVQIPQVGCTKYLGMHLDRKLTWKKHVFSKRKQLGLQLRKLYWLIGRKSKMSIENKLIIYKSILKPVWTYGIQLWGIASNSNIEILQRFQSKVIRLITNAPYVTNAQHRDLKLPTIQEEIINHARKYSDRLNSHPNDLAKFLMSDISPTRRLKRKIPQVLTAV